MVRTRSLLHLTLILLVVVTATAFGAARGQARAAGHITICSGQGIVVQSVDAAGNPVGAPMICPDCALTLLASTLDLPPVWSRPRTRAEFVRAQTLAVGQALHEDITRRARGPPQQS